MWRKLLAILVTVVVFGPALSILYVLSKRWFQPAAKYPDLHTTWVTVSIICGWLGLAVALDLVLQVLRRSRRLPHGAWLFVGVAAGCTAGLLGTWITWLTPLRPWFLLVSGLAISGLFCLLYLCRRRLLLRLFGLVFVAAGLMLFVFALREVHAIADMAGWAKAQGRITHSGGSRSRASKFWKEKLAYEYVVNGRQYTGTEDTWKSSRMRYGWGRNLDRVSSSYVWQEEVAVYYDPDNPANAVLRPGLSYATAFVLRAALLSMLAGMTLLVASTQLGQAKGCATRSDEIADASAERVAERRSRYRIGRVGFALLAACGLLVVIGIQPMSPGAMQVADVDRVPVTVNELQERGYDLLRDGQGKRALNNFTRVLNLDPNDSVAYYNRGHAYMEIGQFSQGVDDWKKAIELDWRMALRAYYARRRLPAADVELDRIIAKAPLDHLDDLWAVSGYAVGYGGEPGDFYTTSLILADHLGEDDFLTMAEDPNAVIRAMGLICLARKDIKRHRAVIQSFLQDATEVGYVPIGCVVRSISLAALAQSVLEDPNTLQYWNPEKTAWYWNEQSGQ